MNREYKKTKKPKTKENKSEDKKKWFSQGFGGFHTCVYSERHRHRRHHAGPHQETLGPKLCVQRQQHEIQTHIPGKKKQQHHSRMDPGENKREELYLLTSGQIQDAASLRNPLRLLKFFFNRVSFLFHCWICWV